MDNKNGVEAGMIHNFKKSEAWATIAVIWALAWPTMLEQVMQTAVQYIDTAMVGVLGTEATAAVGATSTVGWLLYGVLSACSVGFLSIIARVCGAGDRNAAKNAVSQAVLVTLVVGSVFTAVPLLISKHVPVWMQVDPSLRDTASKYFFILYLPMLPRMAGVMFGTVLRAAGDTKTPMKVGIYVNIINIVLNFIMIYPTRELTVPLIGLTFTMPGCGWGVIGAAAASAISYTWSGIHSFIVLWKHPMVSPRGCSLKPDPDILKPCVRIAIPNLLQRIGTSSGYVVFAAMINSLGPISTAAHTIANTVESAFYIPGYGMQTAASTLAGNAYGANDRERMKRISTMFIPIELVLMLLSGAALFFSAPALVTLFNKTPEVVSLGTTVLRMVAVSEPMYGFSIIVEGMMLGVGKTKQPFMYNVIGMWAVRILGTFLSVQLLGHFKLLDYGLIAAWGCMIAHNMLLFVLYLISYIKGTWNPLNTKI